MSLFIYIHYHDMRRVKKLIKIFKENEDKILFLYIDMCILEILNETKKLKNGMQ